MSATELPEWINAETVERAWRRMMIAREKGQQKYAVIGMRAARDRNPRLLRALEGMLENMYKLDEAQRGFTRRFEEREDHRIMSTEVNLVRAAYETLDKGNPLENFEWIYGAAADICGYQ